MEAAAERFFLSPYFAVVGASQDTSKYGYKVLDWYATHSLPATPVNPKVPSIRLSTGTSILAIPSVLSLPHPSETSLSIITPPLVTLKVLEEAKTAGIKAVWLQPGTFDQKVLEYATQEFESGVGGEGGRGGEGWCVLVDGEAMMREAERKPERL